MADTLAMAIKEILDMDEAAFFTSSKRFVSLLGDVAPQLTTERNIIRRVITDDMLLLFKGVKYGDNGEYELLRIKRKLEDEQGLSENWSVTIVTGFADAFGCKHSIGVKREEEAVQAPPKNEETSDDVLSALLKELGSSGHVAYGDDDDDEEETVSANPFDLVRLKVYGTNGSFDGKLTCGPTFMSGETSYVGIKAFFNPLKVGARAKLTWRVYKSDGTPFTEPITGELDMDKGEQYITQSWGWKDKGHWPVGKYRIVASINGGASASVEFDVLRGSYDEVPGGVLGVELFNCPGGNIPSLGNRSYKTSFRNSELATLGFEMSFKDPRRTLHTVMNYIIRDERNNVIADVAEPITLSAGNDICWTGWGWSDTGNWDVGSYSCTVSLGNSKKVVAVFTVR